MILRQPLALCLGLASLLLAGCPAEQAGMKKPPAPASEANIAAARQKLGDADRALVEQQEYCAVSTKQRLGSMGTPYKVTVKGQPVFLCCDHCEKRTLADPERTLAAVEANRKRAREEAGKK